jgi:serine/threonine protein kinase
MDKNIIKFYNINEFTSITKINKVTNFSQVYSAILRETTEEVILKYFIHSPSLDIRDHITKEIIINKYLSDNTDITVNFKGICIDEINKHMFLVLSLGEFNLHTYICNVSYTNHDIKRIFYEAVKILYILHKHGIVHNDIKLENFLFENKKLKIIDFGLSDFLFYSPNTDIINRYVCTEYTKAPDQRKSFETDIYSLGITFIHIILKSYFKPEIKYLNNEEDIEVINFVKENDLIIDIKEYNKEYFLNKVGSDCYDLIKKMICKSQENRIDIISILNHSYFKEFGAVHISNFNIKPEKSKKLNLHYSILVKQNIIPFNLVNFNEKYSYEEYFNNHYEIKYKDIHMDIFKRDIIKIDSLSCKLYFEQFFSSQYKEIFSYDSLINTIILLKNKDIIDNININFYEEYFCMFCILFNSIFTYNKGSITYEDFNKLIKISETNFIDIYFKSLELFLNNFNIYFINSIFSYYIDKIIFEYEIINSNYLKNLKIKCFDIFYNIINNSLIDGIELHKLIIYIINIVISNLLKINLYEYNLNSLIECMRLSENDIININKLKIIV